MVSQQCRIGFATKLRILKWHGQVSPLRCVRNNATEDKPVSVSVWTAVLELQLVQQNPGAWNNEVAWALSTFKAKSFPCLLFKLSWSAYPCCNINAETIES